MDSRLEFIQSERNCIQEERQESELKFQQDQVSFKKRENSLLQEESKLLDKKEADLLDMKKKIAKENEENLSKLTRLEIELAELNTICK